MRFIVLLIALLVIGLLINRQLSKPPATSPDAVDTNTGVQVPKVPNQVSEVPKFEKDINAFMDDAAAERARQLEEQEQ